ncbi:MAG: hypothetical protein KDA53_08620 [Hyphomonas sp.]|nr:hypothetical protein [Hyphomonas sp.]
MKAGDLILMAPAIAFAGGLSGVMKHAAHPGSTLYLATSITLLLVGIGTFAGLLLLVRDMEKRSRRDD